MKGQRAKGMVSALCKAIVKTQSKPCGGLPQGLLECGPVRCVVLCVSTPCFILQNVNGAVIDLVFVSVFATVVVVRAYLFPSPLSSRAEAVAKILPHYVPDRAQF